MPRGVLLSRSSFFKLSGSVSRSLAGEEFFDLPFQSHTLSFSLEISPILGDSEGWL